MALQYTNPPLMPDGQGMFNRPPTVPLNTPTPYTASPASPLAAIAETAVSLLLPVAAFAGTFFGFAGAAGDANESKAVQNFNTGYKTSTVAGTNPRGFDGGQLAGVSYTIFISGSVTFDDGNTIHFNHNEKATKQGVISALNFSRGGTSNNLYLQGTANGSDFSIFITSGGANYNIVSYNMSVSLERVDGQPLDTPTPVTVTAPSGYTGNSGLSNSKQVLPPNLSSAIGWGNSKPIPTNVSRAALGLGNAKSKAPSELFPPPERKTPPLAPPSRSPVQDPPSRSPIQKPTDPLEKPKIPPDPLKPYTPNGDVTGQLAAIGSILGVMNSNVTDIKNNTTPENQQLNAKTGSCQAMQSPSCTKGFEDRISNPLSNKADAIQAAIAANQVGQDITLNGIAAQITELRATMLSNFATAFSFFKNQVIDRAVNMLNLALNIHNALMLSETVGKTLGGILDAVISLTPLQFTDATTGAKTTATSALGSSASALIINIIGVDNYAKLKEDLAISNRIIKSSTNLFNSLENILNSQSRQAQKTGVDVSNIGNALIANNVVNQNSYPKMANSPEANSALPADDVDVVSGKIGLLKQGIAGLNKITGEIKSNVSKVKNIQRNFSQITDLVNGESKTRKQIALQAKNEATRKAKFKFLSIQQIKSQSK